MTESELLTLYLEISAAEVNFLAWCASVTTALYTVAYMIGTKLHIRSVISIVLMFLGILSFILIPAISYSSFELDVIESLRQLQSSGTHLSPFSENLISRIDEGIKPISVISIFLTLAFPTGGIGYLIYQYRIGGKSTGNENE